MCKYLAYMTINKQMLWLTKNVNTNKPSVSKKLPDVTPDVQPSSHGVGVFGWLQGELWSFGCHCEHHNRGSLPSSALVKGVTSYECESQHDWINRSSTLICSGHKQSHRELNPVSHAALKLAGVRLITGKIKKKWLQLALILRYQTSVKWGPVPIHALQFIRHTNTARDSEHLKGVIW